MTGAILGKLGTWAYALLVAAIAWATPVGPLLGLVGVLLTADTLTGIAAAVKRKESITSRRLSRVVWKAVAYQCAVISGFALEGLFPGLLPVAKLCATAIALVEAHSIAENVKSVTGVDLKGIIAKLSPDKQPPQQ